MLTCGDPRVIQVCLDGLENILKVGESDSANGNQMTNFIEMADGVEKIHNLQMHENTEIYKKAYNIIDTYFSDDADGDGIDALGPQVDASGNYVFTDAGAVPQGGFTFN